MRSESREQIEAGKVRKIPEGNRKVSFFWAPLHSDNKH